MSTPSSTRHLVVARYNEPLTWMERLPVQCFDAIFIYNKGEDDLVLGEKVSGLKTRDVLKVIPLPNVGKCDHTYLYHIHAHYDDLGDVTVFLPGSCDHCKKWLHALVSVGAALRYGSSMFMCHTYPGGVKEHFYGMFIDSYETGDERNQALNASQHMLASPIRPFGIWYTANFPGADHVEHVCYFGIFAASKPHVQQRGRESYAVLLQYLDAHPNPEVGHYIERSWLAIFDPVPRECMFELPDDRVVVLKQDMVDACDCPTPERLYDTLGFDRAFPANI